MKELLTAFVDGELSQRQRKAVTRLLQKSSKARELVRQLQENAHKIKQLPRRKCEPSLVDDVLTAIADQHAQPRPMATPRIRRRRWASYVGMGLAASIMLGAFGVLFWKAHYQQNPIDDGGNHSIADNTQNDKPPPIKDAAKIAKKLENKTPEPTPPIKQLNPLLARLIDGTFSGVAAPVLEPKAFTASFSDLRTDDKGTGHLLRRELEQDKVVQLDITVKNNALALDHLRTVLKARGVNVVTDPAAGKAVASKAKAELLVYAENFTSDEMTKLMGELAQQMVVSGPKGNNQKTVDSPFKQVAVAPAADGDKQKLANLLGVNVSAIEPKEGKGLKPDPKRERSVVLLPTKATSTPSQEVRQFVNQRRPQPGTMQVLIKIRQE